MGERTGSGGEKAVFSVLNQTFCPPAIADVADLPGRQETEDLYRTAIRQHINGDPATARGWIQQMPAG
jgi:hypothetical protein